MRNLILLLLLLPVLRVKGKALELEAPPVPDSGAFLMPDEPGSFLDGLIELSQNVLLRLKPDLAEALQTAVTLCCIVMIFSLLQSLGKSPEKAAIIAGTAAITSTLLKSANSLIQLASATILEMSEYGKLLLPVMTAALVSQGGTAASAALYTGTAAFDLVLTGLISRLLVPAVYLFLALAAANSATGEDVLKQFRDMVKGGISWTLKTLLTVFTTYMSISGVVSGTTDAVTLKAAKFTISSVVPVVGGILSDASEAVLVSAGLVKNAAGIYGILAILAVFLGPFVKIWVHYAILKLTAALCSLFCARTLADLIESFSSAMGLLLAMAGSVCLLLLVSTICFLKGVG